MGSISAPQPQPFQVLVIAPDMQPRLLNVADEVREVTMSLNAMPLTGHVTSGDVIRALGSKQGRWDIVWLMTHGNSQGIALSDEMVDASALTADIRNSGAKLLVLNTCESEIIGLQIHEELGIDVITTIVAVPDQMAFRTGAWLARNLAKGMSVREAYEKSKPGQNRAYRLFTSAPVTPTANDRDLALMIENMSRLLSSQLSRLENRVDRLEGKVNETSSQVKDLKRRFDVYSADVVPLTNVRRIAWVIGLILIGLGVPLMFSDFRQLFAINWFVALALVFTTWVTAVVFIMYALGFISEKTARRAD